MLGCGMVHPNVLRNAASIPTQYQRLRVRHGRRAPHDAALRRRRPASCSSRTTCASWSSSHEPDGLCAMNSELAARVGRRSAPTRAQLAARLTAVGLEVEDVEPVGGALDGVVVRRGLSVERHPERGSAVRCVRVTMAGRTAQIVCGAPNVRADMNVPLRMIGARLPDGRAIRAPPSCAASSRTACCARPRSWA